MKRHNLTEASFSPCYYTWSIISFLLVLSFFSCACRNKATTIHPESVNNSTTNTTSSASENPGLTKPVASPTIQQEQYNEVVNIIKAKPDYSLFAEFLEKGKYTNALMGLDKLEYYILVPSNEELKKLDNPTFTQLFYPDVPNQANINFLFSHMAYALADPNASKVYRTMANKTVILDEKSKYLNIDGKQFPIIDEALLPPSIKIFFIDNYLN
jgi:hypothetical protein